ncbi:hypothetical protein JTB14_015227 [Gonioctena quinquepunctata]|nr:hypothetical protein JTB14_015227 [Gonioctena quinquepunctata]
MDIGFLRNEVGSINVKRNDKKLCGYPKICIIGCYTKKTDENFKCLVICFVPILFHPQISNNNNKNEFIGFLKSLNDMKQVKDVTIKLFLIKMEDHKGLDLTRCFLTE